MVDVTGRIVDGDVGGSGGVSGRRRVGNIAVPNTQGSTFTRSRVREITQVSSASWGNQAASSTQLLMAEGLSSSAPAISSSNSRSVAVGTLGGPVSLGTLVSR